MARHGGNFFSDGPWNGRNREEAVKRLLYGILGVKAPPCPTTFLGCAIIVSAAARWGTAKAVQYELSPSIAADVLAKEPPQRPLPPRGTCNARALLISRMPFLLLLLLLLMLIMIIIVLTITTTSGWLLLLVHWKASTRHDVTPGLSYSIMNGS